jgi:hypothetical protein
MNPNPSPKDHVKLWIVLTLAASSITAQTLSISPAGEVRLSPAPPRTAELYASSSPRSGPWQFVTEFAAATQVPTTNQTKFYRARVKAAPLKIIAITATNQTIRGTADKAFTNALLVVNGQTNEGWCSGRKSRLPNRPAGEGNNAIVTQSDFCFRRLDITNTTPALLLLWDDDGYLLSTNLLIGPGPFIPLAPKNNGIKNYLTPSSASTGYDPTVSWWAVISHSSSDSLEGLIPPGQVCAGRRSSQSFNGSWDGEFSMLHLTTTGCKRGAWYDCDATYDGPGKRMTLATADGDGACDWPQIISYFALIEVGAWDENSDGDVSSVFRHSGTAEAVVWIGGHQRGEEQNYWARISVWLNQATERVGGNEVIWSGAPSYYAQALGDRGTSDGTIYVQVPPEGILVGATPSTGRFGRGWFTYGLGISLEPAQ